MVAISDMKKPKSCIKCDVHIAHDYCDHFSQFGVGAKTDGVYSDCPLIDIVECWECEFYQGDGEYCDNDYFAREHGFCFYGKRRSDADPYIQSIEQEEWYDWRDKQEYEDRWGGITDENN